MPIVDRRWLLQQILGTAEALGQTMAPNVAALMVDDLSGYPQDVLAQAFSRVRTTHAGRLTPKVVLDSLDELAGRPSASEAWAMAVNALDERKTVVWTVEMMDAWGAVSELAQRGDLIGARMGFLQAYERLVRIARDERQLPQVQISMGWDKQMAAAAIEKAVQLGYLKPEKLGEHAALIGYVTTPDSARLGYDGPERKGFHPAIAERLAAARDALVAKPEVQRMQRERAAQERDEELRRKKAEAQRRVDEHLRKGGAQ